MPEGAGSRRDSGGEPMPWGRTSPGDLLGEPMAYRGAGKAIIDQMFPPAPLDLTDEAIREARRRAGLSASQGSRRNSFLTGPLGEQTSIPVLGKSVITGG